jgi:hypothetical protein
MSIRIDRYVSALALLLLTICLCPARADDVEVVKDKLFQAKKDYDAKVQKFKMAMTDLLDKREEEARKAGNKKGPEHDSRTCDHGEDETRQGVYHCYQGVHSSQDG